MEQIMDFYYSLPTASMWIPIFAAAAVAFFAYYWYAVQPRRGTLEWITMRENKPTRLTFPKRHPMTRRDILPMLLITAIYAFTAFFQQGNVENIESTLRLRGGESVAFELAEVTEIGEIRYFSGIGTGRYRLSYTADRSKWESVDLMQPYNELLRWNTVREPGKEDEEEVIPLSITAKQFRLIAYPHSFEGHPSREFLEIGELALFDAEGNQLEIVCGKTEHAALFDEQDRVEEYFYTNSSYFDEIYHPRSAIEHLDNVYPYEESHPPLGKLTMALGMLIFGRTPFGWRFMGTLFGVLMLPLLYALLKNMFGKTAVAACGTTLFAAEFMHLVQTRIATIDTYGVFYILAMYYFMYRWLTLPADAKLYQTIPSLFLSGLMFGIGIASKWIVAYGAVGLALLWLIGLIVKYRDRKETERGRARSFAPFVIGTIALCLVFFVAIPLAIYIACYIPYVTPDGELTLENLLKTFWENQVFMLTYHQGAMEPHPYSSRWYQWLFDLRPILYFREMYKIPDQRALFAAFNNPLISWAGLGCVLITGIETFRRKCGQAMFIFIGYLAQILPWFFIARTIFAYHYFPSILFCVIAMSYAMDRMLTRRKAYCGLAVYGITTAAVVLYAAFYPVLIGLYVPRWYVNTFLRWFTSWPV